MKMLEGLTLILIPGFRLIHPLSHLSPQAYN